MPITLGLNIDSLRAQRKLQLSTAEIGTVFERLSSGQRINKASDDAAGLAIADGLNMDRRVFNQGVRNLNDGISLLNIADGAISQLSEITTRIIELAEQSANGVLGHKQRSSLNEEAQALKAEYFRIVQSTEFNDRKLFSADFGELRLQGGFGVDGGIASSLGGKVGTGQFVTSGNFYKDGSGYTNDSALGDLNGDGIKDLVVVGQDSGLPQGFAAIMLGQGDGSFGTAISFSTNTGLVSGTSNSVALGDVNGDGVLDLISAGTVNNTSNQGSVSVRLGVGDGTFGESQSFSAEVGSNNGTTNAISLADFNGDGILDIATGGVSSDGVTDVATITIHLGAGDGSFSNTFSFAAQTYEGSVSSIVAGDFNGDGILDIAQTGTISPYGFASGRGSVSFGNGDGTFGNTISFSSARTDISTGDVNGDGILDLISAGNDAGGLPQGYAKVQIGIGDGSFAYAVTYEMQYGSGSSSAQSLGLVDFNGDGNLDIITSGNSNQGAINGQVVVRLGSGDGSFGERISFLTDAGGQSLATSDLDGDGVLDFVNTTSDSGNWRGSTFLSETTSGVSPLLDFSLSTLADARQALPVLQQKLEQLSQQRGQIGAFMSRANTATRVLQSSSENIAAAESRIREADIAEESAKLVRLNILQQATAAVLSQANQRPSLALQLLT